MILFPKNFAAASALRSGKAATSEFLLLLPTVLLSYCSTDFFPTPRERAGQIENPDIYASKILLKKFFPF